MAEPSSASSMEFLTRLAAAKSSSPISAQLQEFYDFENELRQKFAAKEQITDPYINLIPVFDGKVLSTGANKTKARKIDGNALEEQYISPLKPGKRKKDGEDSFVKDGLAGFKRNWDIFTEGALDSLNWYNPFSV